MYDILIRGGTVVDGSGRDGFPADIAVKNGKIAAIGPDLGGAEQMIDAAGMTVTPGFIDIHRHADAEVFRPHFGELELAQGLTTIINGNCGLSVAPIDGKYRQDVLDYLTPITGAVDANVPTDSIARYLRMADQSPVHTGMLVGAGTVRAAVAGYSCQHLSATQTHTVQELLARSLEEGALGVSLGLGYAPECFTTTRELIETLEPLRDGNIPITVHMREEGDGVCDALREMLAVAKALHAPLEISHLKAMGKRNWNSKIPEAIRLMDEARSAGVDVCCDVYPYTAGSTQLIHILPPDLLRGGPEAITERLGSSQTRSQLRERIAHGTDFDNIAGMVGWDNIFCSTLLRPENAPYEGRSIADIARAMNKDPLDCACDLLVSERCAVTMIDFIASRQDIERIMRLPYSSVISDSTYPAGGKRHPRVYGTFARIIEQFVVQNKVLTLPEAVASVTSNPARALRLKGKGLLRVGMDADILVFDPKKIREQGTYSDPHRPASGFDWVLVGGEYAVAHGHRTASHSGRALYRR